MLPRSIQGMEYRRTLELLGWTFHHEAGPNWVFIHPSGGPLRIRNDWDIPVEDVNRQLEAAGISTTQFWEAYDSLFQ